MNPMTRFARHPARLFLALLLPLALGACVGAAVGGAATVGVAAYDERGLDGVASDLKLAFDVRTRWLEKDHIIPTKVSIEVHEGRALLTGLVQDEKMRADAVGETWKVVGIKQVLNEIEIAPGAGAVDYGRDTWVTTQIKSKFAFDEKVMAVNFHVQTINGVVYLLGIARGADEHRRAIDTVRSIGYVRRVVDHIRVKGAP
ncbi:MAG: BON domain-containing protein [Rhodospirillales bacterium]|nr:BON domain-containing protein [Rhodospirillales bacterium]MSP79835.1 BON domain-containing protein [Rhodospirillales bacterium]